jgi:hypothetical protein
MQWFDEKEALMRSKRFGMIAFLVGLVLVLAGCVQIRQEVTLKANEEWYAKNVITFPKSTVDQIGEEQMTSSQEDFENTTQEAEAKGVKATLDVRTESNGDVVYEITMEGKGLALLNESLFDNAAEFKVLENGHIQFRYDAGDMTSITAMGGSYTFVLKGGKVYSQNATKVEGNTLTWENPATALEAEIGAGGSAGGLSTGVIILLVVLGIVLVAVVAVLLLYLRGQQVKRAQAAVPSMPVAPVVQSQPVVPAVPVEPALPAEPAAPAAPPSEPLPPAQ